MRTSEKQFTSSVFRGFPQFLPAAILVMGIAMSGCATAGEKGSVPTFGDATAKELAFSKDRVTLVFAVDEAGKIQEFRANGTKTFTVTDLQKTPLHADAILSFESFSVIKTRNPKICWTNRVGGIDCVEY